MSKNGQDVCRGWGEALLLQGKQAEWEHSIVLQFTSSCTFESESTVSIIAKLYRREYVKWVALLCTYIRAYGFNHRRLSGNGPYNLICAKSSSGALIIKLMLERGGSNSFLKFRWMLAGGLFHGCRENRIQQIYYPAPGRGTGYCFRTISFFLSFFVSNITRKRLDRFAWTFQGRCGVTMGRPD